MMRLLLILLIAASYTAYHYLDGGAGPKNGPAVNQISQPEVQSTAVTGEDAIHQAFETHTSDLQVEASGTVLKLLEDDTQAPRHQRFVVRLDNGITLLIAHNIDLAERVTDLKAGDTIRFHGEYEWNKKGGIVHWTHHDPHGNHIAGWLRHNGKTYQ